MFLRNPSVWVRIYQLGAEITAATTVSGEFSLVSDINIDNQRCNFPAKRRAEATLFMSWLMSRLRAGRDQTHHLPRGAQVRRPGRGHHSHGVEGCAGRTGVPPQERTDPQVTACQ